MNSLKSTATYLPGILLPRIGSLGLIIVMTHLLPKEEYGLLTLVVTVGELVDASMTTWVRLALLRLGSGGMISRMLANVVLGSVAVTTALGGVLSLVISLVLVPDQPFLFWLAVFSYILAISLLRFGLALLQLNSRSVTYSTLEIGRAIVSFTAAVVTASLFGSSFLFPSLAVGGSTAVFAALAVQKGYSGLPRTEQQYRYKDVTAFAGPLLILSALTIVANAMDRLVLQYFWGPAAVGAYAAVYALARQPIDVLANALNVGGYPALVGHYEQGGRPEASKFLQYQLGFFLKFIIPPACVMLLLQQDLAAALLPSAYAAQSGKIFGIILVGAIAFNLRSVIFDNVFLVERQNMLQLRYFVFVFVVALALAAIAVPQLGVAGAAVIFLTWTTLALLLSALFGRRLIAFPFPTTELGHAASLAGASCAVVALLHQLLVGYAPFARLAAEGGAATIVYGMTLTVLHRREVPRLLGKMRRHRAS